MQNQIVNGFRLSPQQEHLWRLQQQQAGAAYRAHFALHVEGALDEKALAEAVADVVACHEILRTNFRRLPGMKMPLQIVAESQPPTLEHRDLHDLGRAEQSARVQALSREMDERPFDLEHGPVLLTTLVRLSPLSHTLLGSLPALCTDVAGLAGLCRGIADAYALRLRGGVGLPDQPLQYADLAAWQYELAASEEAAVGRAYWEERGAPDPHALKLADEKPARAGAKFAPLSLGRRVSADTLARVEALCARYEASLSECLLACWQLLLWRLTGQAEIVTGTAYDGRLDEELRGLPGLFARHLPLQARPTGELPFHKLLAQVRGASLEAYKWQECFTWEAAGASAGGEDEPRYCPYSFEFVEQTPAYPVGDLLFTPSDLYACTDRFKVRLSCLRTPDALHTELHYDPAILSADAIARLCAQFHQLLTSVVQNPEAPIGALNILDDAERAHLLYEVNETHAAPPARRLLHELFAAQAHRAPAALAVSDPAGDLSYARLDSRASRLASRLASLGVRPDAPVALLLRPSAALVVAALGVLKSGGAYLPLDPSLPPARLSFMLSDTAAPVLLTERALLAEAEALGGALTLCVEDLIPAHDEARDAGGEARNPRAASRDADELTHEREGAAKVSPDNLAYVLYTSGSTGQPKGVMVTHGGVCNYLHWAASAYRLGEGWGAPIHSPLGFDLTVTSLWGPLTSGGAVEFVGGGVGVEGLTAALAGGRHYSVVKLTPSHLELLSETGSVGALVIGGEALRMQAARAWLKRSPGTRLYNEYGPTETVVGCCIYELVEGTEDDGAEARGDRSSEEQGEAVPIGRPIANTRVYVLGEGMRLAPAGVAGELYVGGAGVARGYLGRPELTAERFVPDPFGVAGGGRLYRTGDLARWRADGELEYLGRSDEQVKVRGYRVELGEIEAVLSGHPSVRQAAVALRESRTQDKQLVAYVVVEPGVEFSLSDLRGFLNERLPAYMMPDDFVSLEALPVTANGKLDRRALPDPELTRATPRQGYVAPRTVIEELLVGIWTEVLGLERVGTQDNFFELGGHSLQATQVVSRVREAFQIELALGNLFTSPTVAGLAAIIEQAHRGESYLPALTIAPAPRRESLPLSYAQQRLWFLYQLQPDSPALNIYNAVRLSGALDAHALGRSLNEVVRRHEALRTVFTDGGDEAVQTIQPALALELPLVGLEALSEQEQEEEVLRLLRREALRPFDLAQGPLLRTTLLRLSPHEHVLLLVMHHIVSDGWSMGVLVGELTALYEAFAGGQPSPLEELPIQYPDYAHWQRRWLSGEVLEAQLGYWKRQLAGAPALLELPLDHARPPVQGFRGAKHASALTAELAAALKRLSRQESATLFMTLLAAWKVLLRRYTWQDDIVVGTNIANRNRAETERLIGFFVNNLALRTDLSGNPTFRELLKRVRRVTVEAYEHQDVPFEMVVEALQPPYEPSHTPLFQVLFVMQNAPLPAAEPSGLRLTSIASPHGSSKFDLALYVNETEQGLACLFEYNTDLFDAVTVEQMAAHYRTLLDDIAASPDKGLQDLATGAAADDARLVYAFNDDTD